MLSLDLAGRLSEIFIFLDFKRFEEQSSEWSSFVIESVDLCLFFIDLLIDVLILFDGIIVNLGDV